MGFNNAIPVPSPFEQIGGRISLIYAPTEHFDFSFLQN